LNESSSKHQTPEETVMKTKKKMMAIIEPGKNGCAIYLKDFANINSWGTNIEEVKGNFDIAIKEYIEVCKEEGFEVNPSELLSRYELEYKFDLGTLFDYFSFVNVSALANKLGINGSLMRKYKKGLAFASDAQRKRIEKGLHQIGQELLSVSL
jgi:predicted RNase H-like HicB family nuclease